MPRVSLAGPGFTVSPHGAKWLNRAAWGLFGLVVLYVTSRFVGVTENCQDFDFGAYYRAGQAVTRGESPYQLEKHGALGAFVYAPAYAYLFAPLSRLEYGRACPLWALSNWAFCAGCVLLASQLLSRATPDEPAPIGGRWYGVWLGALPLAGYFFSNVRVGQAGSLLAVLCLGWAVCQRRGRPFVGGLLLAAGVALKLTPVLLLPYLIVRRDWRGLAGAAVGGLAFFSLPALWLGWQGSLDLHLEWYRFCQSTQVDCQSCSVQNQSLLALLARLPLISDGCTLYSEDGLHALERAYPLIVFGLAGALYAWVFWRRRQDRGRLTTAQEQLRDHGHLAWLFVFMTLASPRAWPCNFVGLIVPALMLADAAVRRAPGWKTALAALALVIVVCISPKSDAPAPHWSWLRWLHQSKDLWAAVAVSCACGWTCALQLRCGRKAAFPGLRGRERQKPIAA